MRQLLVFLFILCSTTVFAQDVIVKKDGKSVLVKVLEVGQDKVKYKKHSNLNGPTYSISTSELLSINYENGDVDSFQDITTTKETMNQTGEVKKYPDMRNKEIIEEINRRPVCLDKKEKHSKYDALVAVAFMGIEESSIVSNDEIEMTFYSDSFDGKFSGAIYLKNKSSKIIYVDKASSFVIDKYFANSFFKSKINSSTSGSNIGAGLGLSGIASALGINGTVGNIISGVTIGGGVSSSNTTTYVENPILVIPPGVSEKLGEAEVEFIALRKGEIKMRELLEYTYDNSPAKWTYLVTYSTERNFANYSNLFANVYCKYLYGYIGQPVAGGNGVGANFKYYTTTLIEKFRLKKSGSSRTSIQPNVISGE